MNARRRASANGAGGTEERVFDWPGDPESLTPEAVDFEAVAHVLANTCRRGGRLSRFHSLAAHAVTMSEAIEDLGGDVREAALHALLFDASVAWLGPDAAPSRRRTDKSRRLGARVDRVLREAAGLEAEPAPEQDELLRFIARMADAAEARDVPGAGGKAAAVHFPPLDRKIRLLDPARAARLWFERFCALKGPLGPQESAMEDNAAAGETPEEAPEPPLPGGSRDAA